MKYIYCIILSFLLVLLCFAQTGKEKNIWYFPNKGGLDFNSGTPLTLLDGQMSASEHNANAASIADKNGSLLFYTNGEKVWNRNHDVMPNGNNLNSSHSTHQGVFIVRIPNSDNIYYLFAINDTLTKADTGLLYSVIDMSLDNGLGDITAQKDINLIDSMTEKVTAVMHANNRDIWLVSRRMGSNDFYSYLITEAGINTTPVISSGGTELDFSSSTLGAHIGAMKVSPDGNFIALAHYGISVVDICKFNPVTGEVSDHLVLENMSFPEGVEFSCNSRFLYVTNSSSTQYVRQYDLTASDIKASEEVIFTQSDISIVKRGLADLQMGPDKKIYVVNRNAFTKTMDVIPFPNEPFPFCGYLNEALFIDRLNGTGLPNFLPEPCWEFENTTVCPEEVTEFETEVYFYDSLVWDFGDPSSGYYNRDTGREVTHVYQNEGDYAVSMFVYRHGFADTIIQEVSTFPDVVITDSIIVMPSQCNSNDGFIDITVNGVEPLTFSWSNNETSEDIFNLNTKSYQVYIKDSNNCSISDTFWLKNDCDKSFYIPNVFSPNADGANDNFTPLIIGYSEWTLNIYDRFGKKIITLDELNPFWMPSSLNINDGVYTYYFTSPVSKGDVQVRHHGNILAIKP